MANEAHKAMTSAQQEALYANVKELMPAEKRKADLLAEMRKVHYDACIRKGFTPDQALFLCTQMEFKA